MKQYTKKQIQEAINYWEKQLNEASFEEADAYERGLKNTSTYLVPVVKKCLNAHEIPGTVKSTNGDDVDLLNAACAIAFYVKQNSTDSSLREMAEQIIQLGAGYMI